MPILRTSSEQSPTEQREKEKMLEDIGASLKFLAVGSSLSHLNESLNGFSSRLKALTQMPSIRIPNLQDSLTSHDELDLEEYGLNRSFLDELEHTEDGGFIYQGKRIRGLSTDKLEGKLLKALLEAEDNFLTDQDICKALSYKNTRDCGFIFRNLKKVFRKNGLKLIVERRKRLKGYVAVDIELTQKVSQK